MKSTHFLFMRETNFVEKLIHSYIREIVRLNEIPKIIVSNCDSGFTSRLWREIEKSMGTKLNFSITFHPQTDS